MILTGLFIIEKKLCYIEPIFVMSVRGRNRMKMQRLILGIGMCWMTVANAQQNVPSSNNSNVSNGNANPVELEIAVDSLNVSPAKMDKIESKEIKASEKKASAPKMKTERSSENIQQRKETEEYKKSNKALEDLDVPATEESDSPSVPQSAVMQEQFVTNEYSSKRQMTRRSASPEEQMNMDAAVGYYNTTMPNSFESHFYKYLAGHFNIALYPELQAAAEMEPENTEVKKQLAAYHIITQDSMEALPIIADLIKEDVVTQGQLLYANDLLLSNEENAVLVLHGFDDMFAAYYVQHNNAVRNDVDLLSLDFMQSADYRRQWTDKGYDLPESNVIDTAYLGEFCKLNTDKPLQLSLTIPKAYFVPIKSNLYPVGLTFRYSTLPINNFESNYRLWKQDLNFGLVENDQEDRNNNWSMNYLPMLVSLKKQLALEGQKAEEELVAKTIRKIGDKNSKTENLKKVLDK